MKIRLGCIDDLPVLTDIYNYAVLNLNATFDEKPNTLNERRGWFNSHQNPRFPLLVATIENEGQEKLIGWGSLSPFHPRSAYRFTGETSIYVDPNFWGLGAGSQLLAELLLAAQKVDYHTLTALIAGGNEASIKLHQKYGFQVAGTYKEVGYKFNQWQDLIVMQKLF